MHHEIILFNSFVYSIILYYKKHFFLKHISIELYFLLSSVLSLIALSAYFLYNPKSIFTKSNLIGFKKILPFLIVMKIVSLINGYIYYYLLKQKPFGYFQIMNKTSLIIFTSLIGVLLLNEKINLINILGIVFCIIGMYLVNC